MIEKKQVYSDEFKEEVAKYAIEHPKETDMAIAEKFGVSDNSVRNWKKKYQSENGISSRGSGNRSSDDAKEIARLKKELKDAQDALNVLKKAIGILGS